MVLIAGLFHPNIPPSIKVGEIIHLQTIDPNFLGHPSTLLEKEIRPDQVDGCLRKKRDVSVIHSVEEDLNPTDFVVTPKSFLVEKSGTTFFFLN